MSNEISFILRAIIDLLFVLLLFRFGKAGLVAAIVVNIILVSTFGAKLVHLFGVTTNAGNVSYACVFFAATLLNEYYGRREAVLSVIIGFASLVLFMTMSQFVITMTGLPETFTISQSMAVVFKAVPRVAFASMVAYVCASGVHIWLYDFIKKFTKQKQLWLRNIASALVGQAIDSVLFFSIAFAFLVPNIDLWQAMLAGFLLKVLVALISTPFLYASKRTACIDS